MDEKIQELIDELYQHPIGSVNYINIKTELEQLLKEIPGYETYLICFPSKLNLQAKHDETMKDMFELPEFIATDVLSPTDSELEYPMIFSEQNSFLSDPRFTFVERFKAEYNSAFKQLIVACYITDGEKIVLLNAHKGRISDRYVLVQGHVEFDTTCYLKSEFEVLWDNINREISEELKCEYPLFVDKYPKYIYNGERSLSQLEHFGVIYEIRFGHSMDFLLESLTSGEPDKHDVVVLDLKDYEQFKDKLDDWSICVIEDLLGINRPKTVFMIEGGCTRKDL